MVYWFKDILNEGIYCNSSVLFVFGKHLTFNNLVCDKIKKKCLEGATSNIYNSVDIASEFGLDAGEDSDEVSGTDINSSVNFNTFMDVIGVSSINGKWYCKTELKSLSKKQMTYMLNYIKNPSDNGVLVITSSEWADYKELLKNKTVNRSNNCNMFRLDYPRKDTLGDIAEVMFKERGVRIDRDAIDFFVLKMGDAYDKYESTVENIVSKHSGDKISIKNIKVYMKGVENFIIDDFITEITKPLSSGNTNNKKVLRMLVALEDGIGAVQLARMLYKSVVESIEFRVLINQGYIPIGINYFFKDVIDSLGGKESKFSKMNEWVFRRKVYIASMTSLRDWEYIKLILGKALDSDGVNAGELENRCEIALYEVVTRSVLTNSRINNIIGLDNTIMSQVDRIDKIVYKQQ